MSSPLPTRILIAAVGLELLPVTRLKVACSLLAADHLEVVPVAWGRQPVALLVADAGTPEGREAIAVARRQQLRLLTLGRETTERRHPDALPHAATVRDIAMALKRLLTEPAPLAAPVAGMLPPLLEQLRLDQPPKRPMLLEHGLLRLVVEASSGTLHMLRRMPMAQLVEQAFQLDWRITVLSEQDWRRVYRPDVSARHAIETVWWQVAAMPAFDPPAISGQALELAAWPDLDPASADPQWPMLLAFLMHRAWRPVELSTATGLPLEMVRRVMAAVQLSGLSTHAGNRRHERVQARQASAAGPSRSFLRIAKHFGLKLLGLRHE